MSIFESSLNEVKFNWNGTNYTLYNDSLILMYNFENKSELGENSTIFADVSKYGNNNGNCTIGSGFCPKLNTTAGRYGNAMTFDGINDFIMTGNISRNLGTVNGPYTLSGWINVMPGETDGNIIHLSAASNGGGWCLPPVQLVGGKLRVQSWTGVAALANGTTTINPGVWYHFTNTWDSTNGLRLYVNGQLDASASQATYSASGSNNYFFFGFNSGIGCSYENGYFNGSIDEVRIYNRSLSADEVNVLYKSNLIKFNATQWYLQVNYSTLSGDFVTGEGYTYSASAKDIAGNENKTDTRTINIDSTPKISFISPPTPANETSTSNTSVLINVSLSEPYLNEVKFNWNGTNYTLYNDSLVLMMNFENKSELGENSTYVVDLSKYGNNGNCSGVNCPALNTTAGKYGNAMTFDGINDYFITLNISNTFIPNGFALASWFKTSSGVGTKTILRTALSGVTDTAMVVNWTSLTPASGDKLTCGGYGGTWTNQYVIGTSNVNDNNWHYGVCVYDGTTMFVYVDGRLENSFTFGVDPYYTSLPWYIGRYPVSNIELFNGSIDEVRIYNRSLSADEVYELYASNLMKFNTTQWYLQVNQTKYSSSQDFIAGTYTYSASAKDVAGNENKTDTRTITLTSNPVTDCSNLTVANTLYILNNNIVNHQINTACMNITAQNITLDCQGYNIYSIKNYTGVFSNQLNTTVKNCNITMGQLANPANTNARGIYFYGANYSNIINNNLTSQGYGIYFNFSSNNILINNTGTSLSHAIDIWYSQNNILTNNIGISNSSGAYGLFLYNSQNSNLTNNVGIGNMSGYGIILAYSNNSILINNTGIATGNYAGLILSSSSNNILINNTGTSNSNIGIYVTTSSHNNNLTNNVGASNSQSGILINSNNINLINNTGISNSGPGITLSSSIYTILINNTGTSNSSRGIYLSYSPNTTILNTQAIGYLAGSTGFFIWRSNNTLIQDCINISGILFDVDNEIYSYNTTFLNCSYNISKEINNASSSLTRKWYYRAYANDTAGNNVIAEINATDKAGNLEFSIDTDATGFTGITNITDYDVTGGTRYFYSNYTIRADNSSYLASPVSHTFNASLGNNLYDYFTFSDYLTDCKNLSIAGRTYTLQGDIINHNINTACMNISAQNITLDCNGYNIYSIQNYTGVFSNQLNTTVKNCNITMGDMRNSTARGIYFIGSNYSNILNNNATSGRGIVFLNSSNNTLTNNRGTSNSSWGIFIDSSSNNTLINNTGTSSSGSGIAVSESSKNILTNNTGISTLGDGIRIASSNNSILTNNTGTSDSGAGIIFALITSSSSNNIFINNRGTSTSGEGIYLDSASNHTLTNNIGTSTSSVGIYLTLSSNNILINNSGNGSIYGIQVASSSNNTLINNRGTSSSGSGIYLSSSSNNTLINNTGTSSIDVGIILSSSSNNTLINNTGTSNSGIGIYLYSSSNNNILTNNTGTSNSSEGIYLGLSLNNTLINTQAIGYLAGSTGFFISSSNNTLIQDCINVSGVGFDVQISGYSYDTTFINCSYNISKETVTATSTLIKKWWYRAYANDTSGNPVVAEINATNVTGNFQFSIDTNSSGWTNMTNITDYVVSGGTRYFYSNYTIRADNNSYVSSPVSHTFNASLGNNLYDYFTFSDYITDCKNLTQAGRTYALGADIVNHNINTACINISAQDITLDCNGYNIYSIKNYTGVFSNQYNTTVKNCNITMGSTDNLDAIGIYWNSATYGNILNNNATAGRGIFLVSDSLNNNLTNNIGRSNSISGIVLLSSYNLLTNNTGISNSSFGIYLISSLNKLINNKGTSNSNAGIYFSSTLNTIFINNTGTSDSGEGIYLYYSSNNILINNTGISNSTSAIYLVSSLNNTLKDNTGTSDYTGIYLSSSSDNNTLINNRGNGTVYGIFLSSSSNNTLTNNTGTSTSSTGIWLSSSSNNILTNNTGTSSIDVGIFLSSSSNNTLTNNRGTSNSGIGIYLSSFSNNNIFINTTGTSNSSAGIYLLSSSNNTLINTQAIGYLAGSTGFFISSSNNTLIEDCINISGISLDVQISGYSDNSTFTNCSYNIDKETIVTSTLIRKWYYRAYVNDSAGTALSGVNVTFFNKTGNYNFNLTTDVNGFTQIGKIIDYINNGGTRYYYSPYSINATNGSLIAGHSFNASNGNNLSDWFTLTPTAADNPPEITAVYNSSITTTLNQGPLATSVIINFTAYDADGNLNYSTARVNISLTGEVTRQNMSCSRYESSPTYANFTCNITMFWYDGAGNWNITASIWDNTTLSVKNDSTTLYVGATTAFEIAPGNLTWNAFIAGSTNQTANNDPLILNNTGNQPVGIATGTSNITINATHLRGEIDNTKILIANNFSVSTLTGGACTGDACLECGGGLTGNLSYGRFTNITSAFLPKGNYTQEDGTGREQLYFCLRIAGRELTGQPYSTSQEGSWVIRIFLVAFIPAKKKRKKRLQDDKLLDALNLITGELKEKEELLQKIIEKLKSRYNVEEKEIWDIIKSGKETTIPITIFSKQLGGLEAVSKYMKENLNMTYSEIAKELKRNERTIWTSYKRAKQKQKEIFIEKKEGILIPISIFKDKELTVFESVISYLKEKGIKYSEIAKLLNRDQRNIRTIYIRTINTY